MMQRSVADSAIEKSQVKIRVSLAADRSVNVLHSFTKTGAASAASAASTPLSPDEPDDPLEPELPELLPPVSVVELLQAPNARATTPARKGTASTEKGRSMDRSVADVRAVG